MIKSLEISTFPFSRKRFPPYVKSNALEFNDILKPESENFKNPLGRYLTGISK